MPPPASAPHFRKRFGRYVWSDEVCHCSYWSEAASEKVTLACVHQSCLNLTNGEDSDVPIPSELVFHSRQECEARAIRTAKRHDLVAPLKAGIKSSNGTVIVEQGQETWDGMKAAKRFIDELAKSLNQRYCRAYKSTHGVETLLSGSAGSSRGANLTAAGAVASEEVHPPTGPSSAVTAASGATVLLRTTAQQSRYYHLKGICDCNGELHDPDWQLPVSWTCMRQQSQRHENQDVHGHEASNAHPIENCSSKLYFSTAAPHSVLIDLGCKISILGEDLPPEQFASPSEYRRCAIQDLESLASTLRDDFASQHTDDRPAELMRAHLSRYHRTTATAISGTNVADTNRLDNLLPSDD